MAKQEIGDLEEIRQKIESWMAAKLPDAQGLKLDELKFPEESGESSVTLLLNAKYGGKENKFVFRMEPVDSQVFDSHDLKLQYDLMALIGEAGIPAPEMIGFESDQSLLSSDFYMMNFIDGQIPTDNPPFAFGSWVTELSDQERAAMWRNGLETISKIHLLDMDNYDLPTLPRSEAGQSPVQHEIDKFDAMFVGELRDNAAPELRDAMEFIKDNAPQDGPVRLCWGDCRVGNIIWKDLAPAAVIDWEMASLGDPLMDVAWWFWIDHVNSVGLGLDVVTGLPERADLYKQWHEITGLPIDNSDYYDLFAALRYAIILEKKFVAMKAAGLGEIPNFSVPFVAQMLDICKAAK